MGALLDVVSPPVYILKDARQAGSEIFPPFPLFPLPPLLLAPHVQGPLVASCAVVVETSFSLLLRVVAGVLTTGLFVVR